LLEVDYPDAPVVKLLSDKFTTDNATVKLKHLYPVFEEAA
jgi:hypothetical protein